MSVTLEQLTEQSKVEAQTVLNNVPEKLNKLNALIGQLFSNKNSVEIADQFQAQAASGEPNESMQKIVKAVREEIGLAISDFQVIERWLQFLVPKIEDGNNFGVEIQRFVIKLLGTNKTTLQKSWDSFPDYTWQRGAGVEKIAASSSTESTSESSSSKSTGGKDGDENKTSSSESKKQVTSTKVPLGDYVAHVTAVDVKWYFNLLHLLESTRDTYAIVWDVIDKNEKKLLLPRGHKDKSSGLSMY